MGDDALELVAGEQGHAAAGDPDDGIARGASGGEGVDGILRVHHVDGRNGHARGDRHLLDEVEEAALVVVGRVQVDLAPAEAAGDDGATSRELQGLAGRGEEDDRRRADRGEGEDRRIPEGRTTRIIEPLPGQEKDQGDESVDRGHDPTRARAK